MTKLRTVNASVSDAVAVVPSSAVVPSPDTCTETDTTTSVSVDTSGGVYVTLAPVPAIDPPPLSTAHA